MTERGGQMFPYEVELERPLPSSTGRSFHVDVIADGTILELMWMAKLRLEHGCMIRRADASGCMHRMGKRYFGI